MLINNNLRDYNPQELYKYLLRSCSQLPPDAANYYRASVR